MTKSAGEDIEKLKPSSIATENEKWFDHLEIKSGSFL